MTNEHSPFTLSKRILSAFFIVRWAILIASSLLLVACETVSVETTVVPPINPAVPATTERWWDDAVFYEIFVRSFYDSDGDGVGDLNGIIEKLDYLETLGVDALWLMPIAESPSYHGYDVVDYYAVDVEYGTADDFKNLVAELHARDMRIIVDLVLNHTSSQHEWFQAAHDPNSDLRDWYVWNEREEGGWHCRDFGCYYGIFWGEMPDLNYLNEDVTAEMQEVTRYWLEEMNVDGFRLDAIKHLIEVNGMIENAPETRAWFADYNEYVKSIKPNALLIGEVWSTSGESAAYVLDGSVDLTFDFDISNGILATARGNSFNALAAYDYSVATYPDAQFGSFITNHDQNRVLSQLFRDPNRAKVAATILLTSPGVPFIYYGEEIGMDGMKPDEWLRTPLHWSAAPNGGFTTAEPWMPLNTNVAEVNIADQQRNPNSVWNHYQQLIELRQTHDVLRHGEWLPLPTSTQSLYATLRYDEDIAILTVINVSNQPLSDYVIELSQTDLLELLGEGKWYIEDVLMGGAVRNVHVTDEGWNDYQPSPELAPLSTHIILLQKMP